jgi:hypothetical protein
MERYSEWFTHIGCRSGRSSGRSRCVEETLGDSNGRPRQPVTRIFQVGQVRDGPFGGGARTVDRLVAGALDVGQRSTGWPAGAGDRRCAEVGEQARPAGSQVADPSPTPTLLHQLAGQRWAGCRGTQSIPPGPKRALSIRASVATGCLVYGIQIPTSTTRQKREPGAHQQGEAPGQARPP